ncbi:MAG TPA: cell division ATP-binding protein FtsE [Fibrobacteria bacterium]|nr:cell division ATP-binding protein FtsE [Fibrobacteria bacterium]
MISFIHVSKKYEKDWKALQDVHFRLDRGEFVFLTGPSGAGKTTILKLIYMDERPDIGEVLISFNKDLAYRSAETSLAKIQLLRRRLGIVFQDFKLLPDRNVFENVAFALRVAGYSSKRLKHRVYEVLTLTGISHKAKNLPHQLSGGEQQRVSIARAMANEPYIVLADEPTGNLDPQTSQEIVKIFQNINASGTAVLMATHDYGLINSLPYRRLLLNRGALVNRDFI